MRCGWTRIRLERAPPFCATCGWAGGCGAPLLSIVSARTVWSKAASRAPWPAIAAILVIARLCEPASELHIAEDRYRRTALDDLLGAPAERVDDDRLYRALDRLPPHKQALETHLKERLGALFDLDYELLLYDVTSTYFEGQAEGNGLARRGYSRDHRGDCKQVCIGLVVTRDGVPLGYEVFAGNRTDVTTVEEIVTTMEDRRYGQARRVWVMDRGMASAENIAWLRGGQRLYVIGASKSELKKFAGELADRRNWRQVRDGVEAKVCAGPDGSETFLLVRSAERQQKEEAMHARFCERIETALASLQRRIERAQKPIDRGAAERQIGRLLGRNSRAAARYAIRLVDDQILPAGLRLEWSRRAEWDDWSHHSEGCYVLRTNLRDWSSEALWRTYIQLSEAEAAFRIHKSELSIRPIWHQREDRVLAHILVCFLAHVLWKTLEQWQSRAGLGNSPRTLLQELRHHQHRRHPADGGLSRPRTAIALRRAPRSRPSGLAGAPRSPLARTTSHAPSGAHNVVPTLGVKYLKSHARASQTAEVGLRHRQTKGAATDMLNLSRRSRNQKGVRRLSNNQPRLSRAVLDDPPIYIRPNCSRQSGCKGKNPLDLSHDGPTILPKNISAATPICAKTITS